MARLHNKSSRVKKKQLLRRDGGYKQMVVYHNCNTEQWHINCSYCSTLLVGVRQMSIDHVHPLSKGGTNDLDNLVIACYNCNCNKGDKILV